MKKTNFFKILTVLATIILISSCSSTPSEEDLEYYEILDLDQDCGIRLTKSTNIYPAGEEFVWFNGEQACLPGLQMDAICENGEFTEGEGFFSLDSKNCGGGNIEEYVYTHFLYRDYSKIYEKLESENSCKFKLKRDYGNFNAGSIFEYAVGEYVCMPYDHVAQCEQSGDFDPLYIKCLFSYNSWSPLIKVEEERCCCRETNKPSSYLYEQCFMMDTHAANVVCSDWDKLYCNDERINPDLFFNEDGTRERLPEISSNCECSYEHEGTRYFFNWKDVICKHDPKSREAQGTLQFCQALGDWEKIGIDVNPIECMPGDKSFVPITKELIDSDDLCCKHQGVDKVGYYFKQNEVCNGGDVEISCSEIPESFIYRTEPDCTITDLDTAFVEPEGPAAG